MYMSMHLNLEEVYSLTCNFCNIPNGLNRLCWSDFRFIFFAEIGTLVNPEYGGGYGRKPQKSQYNEEEPGAYGSRPPSDEGPYGSEGAICCFLCYFHFILSFLSLYLLCHISGETHLIMFNARLCRSWQSFRAQLRRGRGSQAQEVMV